MTNSHELQPKPSTPETKDNKPEAAAEKQVDKSEDLGDYLQRNVDGGIMANVYGVNLPVRPLREADVELMFGEIREDSEDAENEVEEKVGQMDEGEDFDDETVLNCGAEAKEATEGTATQIKGYADMKSFFNRMAGGAEDVVAQGADTKMAIIDKQEAKTLEYKYPAVFKSSELNKPLDGRDDTKIEHYFLTKSNVANEFLQILKENGNSVEIYGDGSSGFRAKINDKVDVAFLIADNQPENVEAVNDNVKDNTAEEKFGNEQEEQSLAA